MLSHEENLHRMTFKNEFPDLVELPDACFKADEARAECDRVLVVLDAGGPIDEGCLCLAEALKVRR